MVQRNNLDFIRTLLALGVLAFHAFGYIGIKYPQFPWVPAFIAISGFLITESMKQSTGYGHFAWKRFLRVTPAFLLSLILVACLGGDFRGALIDWVSLLIGNDIGSGATNPPLRSLSIEEILYFSLAVWFALGIYKTQQRATSSLFVMFLLVAIAANFASARTFPIYIVSLSFISGSFLYVIRNRVKWSVIAGILCLATAAWMRNQELKTSVIYAVLIGPTIAYGLITIAFHTNPVFCRYKQTVGDPSLGIYVYHSPIIYWLNILGVHGVWLVIATLALTLLIAMISWHVVEKQILKFRNWRPAFLEVCRDN